MSYADKILERANVRALREFLLYGNEYEKYTSESYEDRFRIAYNDFVDIAKQYDDKGEDPKLFTAMIGILTEHEHIHMEIELQVGFLLAKDIYTRETVIKKSVVRYDEMLFSGLMLQWLENKRTEKKKPVRQNTWDGVPFLSI